MVYNMLKSLILKAFEILGFNKGIHCPQYPHFLLKNSINLYILGVKIKSIQDCKSLIFKDLFVKIKNASKNSPKI